jgi:hypothetical protein
LILIINLLLFLCFTYFKITCCFTCFDIVASFRTKLRRYVTLLLSVCFYTGPCVPLLLSIPPTECMSLYMPALSDVWSTGAWPSLLRCVCSVLRMIIRFTTQNRPNPGWLDLLSAGSFVFYLCYQKSSPRPARA